MNSSQLRANIESANPDSHFFDRRTMRFFGDSMSNYGVRAVVVSAWSDEVDPETKRYVSAPVEAWELYRRRPVKSGLKASVYFDKQTFKRLCGVEA